MHPKALLQQAADLLRTVLAFEQPADAVVSAFCRRQRALGARERHALAETVYAVLRRRLWLQHVVQGGHGPLERRLAIAGWQGDARTLQASLEPHESSWLAGLPRVPPDDAPDKLRHNLPDWLAVALQREVGVVEFRSLAQALLEPAPLDLRVNIWKARRDDVLRELVALGHSVLPTPFSPWGLRVQGRPALQNTAAFRDGRIEVQDEGSQLLAALLDAKRGEMVVDFCAGAGGKTLALGAAMRNTGRLYAFDTSGHRLEAMKPRVARSGLSNVHPMQIAHERDDRVKRLSGKIDRVLVDAPCSGLGTLRRNPDLKWRQSPQAVGEMGERQLTILRAAAALVKPGGRLIYATCSLLELENEDIARSFEQAQSGFETVAAQLALEPLRIDGVDALVQGARLRLWPHRQGTDGFFAAVWQRKN
jgi:16S rRNA (cytosine967-C5)-methyltransferase